MTVPPNAPHPGPAQLTIGLITSCLWSVQLAEWLGVREAARLHNVNLISYVGRELNSQDRNYSGASDVYNLVSAQRLDGLIVSTGSIGWMTSHQDLEKFCKGFQPLPLVSIEVPFAGIPSIQMEDGKGVRAMVLHMVQKHGYRKIGFVAGPEHSQVARERLQAYKETLAECGLPFSERLVVPNPGSWTPEQDQLEAVFDERDLRPGVDFEVMVAASDSLAIIVQTILQHRGFQLPKDVAVSGFDDTLECRSVTPSITTLQPPHYEIGKKAVELVLAQIRGENVPERSFVGLKLIVRESCGCVSQTVAQISTDSMELAARLSQSELEDQIEAALGGRADYLEPTWPHTLVQAYLDDLAGKSEHFLTEMQRVFHAVMRYESDSSLCHEVVSILHSHTLPSLKTVQEIAHAEVLWQKARVLINVITQKDLFKRDWARERFVMREYEKDQEISTTFTMPRLMETLAKRLPLEEIDSCFLALYDNPSQPLESAQLVLAFDKNGPLPLPEAASGLRFDPRRLIPEQIEKKGERFEYIVESLYYLAENQGFILFESARRDGVFYDLQRLQISSALKRVMLIEQVESQKQELTKANEELSEAYDALQKGQQRLVTSEKMASLGRLSAGIAHEMNTPLASVRAALQEIQHLAKEYTDSIGNASVLAEDHHAIAEDMRKYLKIAETAAQKSASYIRGIKAQTTGLNSKKAQKFYAGPVIDDTLTLIEFAIRKGNCMLEKQLDRSVELFGDPHSLGQIVTNLVTNAVDACPKEGGRLSVTLKKDAGSAVLEVSDNGSGIPDEYAAKIFDPLFTTKPFGTGTGLGLTIVHDLVDEFKGKLAFASKPGQTTFTISFPQEEDSAWQD